MTARQREFERELTLAWHIAALSGAAQAGKLKPLKHYLDAMKQTKAQTPGQMMAALKGLKAGGAVMTITKVQRESR